MYHIGCRPGEHDWERAADGSVKLTFSREELLYDIRNNAYIAGDVWGEENQHGQHVLVDVGEEGNVDRIWRVMAGAHAGVVEMLYPYTKQAVAGGEEIGDRLEAPKEYVIEMKVPSTFSITTLRLLSALIHEYMVSRAMYDWMSTTHPEAAEPWLLRAQEAAQQIKLAKTYRSGKLRLKPSPF